MEGGVVRPSQRKVGTVYLSLGKPGGLRIISDRAVGQTAVVAVVPTVTHAVVDAMTVPCECIVWVLSVAV